jgi:Uma2 family endonuclease
VNESRSKTDSLSKLKRKMEEYRENGIRLGWLIDRHNQQAFVYHQDGMITCYAIIDAIKNLGNQLNHEKRKVKGN